jgi:hypothetical protein
VPPARASIAAQHPQSLWGTLAHLPGLKVVVPSNPHSTGSCRGGRPERRSLVFIEHKDAYLRKLSEFSLGREVPEEPYEVELGRVSCGGFLGRCDGLLVSAYAVTPGRVFGPLAAVWNRATRFPSLS